MGDNGLGRRGFTLDTSLERVFGQGATMLALEFEGGTGGTAESKESSSEQSSEEEEDVSASTPSRDEVGKKRLRGKTKFGDISGISGLKGNHELSSDGETSEDADNEVKKPRLATGNEMDGLDDIADLFGTVAVEEDGQAGEPLVEQLEGVPLEEPGPNGVDGGAGKFSPGRTQ